MHRLEIFTTGLIIFIMLLIYFWLRYRYTYWQRHRIPYITPIPILGNLRDLLLFRISFGDFFRIMYSGVGKTEAPVVGIYLLHTPALILRNPDLIRDLMIKNSNSFLNRYEAADPIHDNWGSMNLALSKFSIWRESRKIMSKYFTSGKIKKRMYPLMMRLSLNLEQHISQRFEMENNNSEIIIEVRELCALFTTDLTAMLSFTINAQSLNGNLRVRKALIDLLTPTFKKGFHFFVLFFLPHFGGLFRAKVFPEDYMKSIQQMMLENLMQRASSSNLDEYKDDLTDILLKFQKQSLIEEKHEFAQHPDFILAQMAIILLAGFETSSSVIAFILYELAKQPEIQQKLRTELKNYFQGNGKIKRTLTYEELQGLSYLNQVVAEGLRMYPAAAFINREYTPGPNESGYSLKPYVDYEMPSGMPAYISILGLHRDEKFWPNPDNFDPERFRTERLQSIHPMTYIPFGVGPHACIGSRLGILQVKLGLVHILKHHQVEKCKGTPKKIIFEPKSFMLQNKGGIELKFVRDSVQ